MSIDVLFHGIILMSFQVVYICLGKRVLSASNDFSDFKFFLLIASYSTVLISENSVFSVLH